MDNGDRFVGCWEDGGVYGYKELAVVSSAGVCLYLELAKYVWVQIKHSMSVLQHAGHVKNASTLRNRTKQANNDNLKKNN